MIPYRKIHHLCADNGKNGEEFRYLAQQNPKVQFDYNRPIYFTEKCDGTTCMANYEGVFKRADKYSKGDPLRKDFDNRYTFRTVDLSGKGEDKYITKAVTHYLELFKSLPPPYTLYFEVVGDKIGARYKGLSYDIRVFDVTQHDEWVNYLEIPDFCKQYQLPRVNIIAAHLFDNFDNLLTYIKSIADSKSALGNDYNMEGVVLRQNYSIAKIRFADLQKFI